MKDRTVSRYSVCVWEVWGMLVGAGRVNKGDEGEGICLIDFIYLYEIEQRNLLQLL
jgi:hypothetical protein